MPEENIIIGNVAFYGATSGEAYIRGMAGERFCVRNSGVQRRRGSRRRSRLRIHDRRPRGGAGATGRNFAAGMSGGIAYVLDETGDFPRRCNLQMVGLEKLEDPDEIEQVWKMIQRHQTYTRSELRRAGCWPIGRHDVPKFVKVMPKDYKRVLQVDQASAEAGLSGEEAIMAAFEENARDVARVGGG